MLAVLIALSLFGLGLESTSAQAPRAPSRAVAETTDNPLAGRPWGVGKTGMDSAWGPYVQSTGTRRAVLAKIALTPRATWFTTRLGHDRIGRLVRAYIDSAQGGDPNTLVQMTIFGIRPWEHDLCRQLPTAAQRAYYRTWIDLIAAEIADAHVLLVIQPDAPFALCASNPAVPLGLMRYAVESFTALPNTSVYIEAGAADWLKDDPARALRILIPAGVELARGFAFNSTHYDSTPRQIRYGARVAAALEARGIPGKKFVINTSSNGRPFKGYTYRGPEFNNPRLCATPTSTRCLAIGLPPTTDVGNPQWGLAAADAALAVQYVDAYIWIGRPWNWHQASPFVMSRALSVVNRSPYRNFLPAKGS